MGSRAGCVRASHRGDGRALGTAGGGRRAGLSPLRAPCQKPSGIAEGSALPVRAGGAGQLGVRLGDAQGSKTSGVFNESESESKKTPFSIEKFQMVEAAAAAVSNTLGKVAHSSKCVFKAGVSAAP